jgi:hypothetical protein
MNSSRPPHGHCRASTLYTRFNSSAHGMRDEAARRAWGAQCTGLSGAERQTRSAWPLPGTGAGTGQIAASARSLEHFSPWLLLGLLA